MNSRKPFLPAALLGLAAFLCGQLAGYSQEKNRTQFTVLPTTGAIRGNDFYFIANSQIDNLNGDKVMDVTKLAAVRIAVVRLP